MTSFFGRGVKADKASPLPATDSPEVDPIPLPRMSPAREQAIAAAVAAGKARGLEHALFKWRAGLLDLPV